MSRHRACGAPRISSIRLRLEHDAVPGLMLDDLHLAGIADVAGTLTGAYAAPNTRRKPSRSP
jgi:hypothetical protein